MSETSNEVREIATAVRRGVRLAHGFKIVEARTPVATLAEAVEEVGSAYARMLDKLASAGAALEKQRKVEGCEHPAPALQDPRLFVKDDEPPAWLECALCHSHVCPFEACHHRIGQHGEMGCRVEGCECSASHK